MTAQDFHDECKAQFVHNEFTARRFKHEGFDIDVSPHSGAVGIFLGRETVFLGKDLSRAGSILYGITANKEWLKFVGEWNQ